MEYRRNPNKGEGIQKKKKKKMKCEKPIKPTKKIAFFNAIKSEETAKIYM